MSIIAKLYIYAFFLIAITTIIVGAPLEVSSKLTSHHAQLEKYKPPNQSLSRCISFILPNVMMKMTHFFLYCDKIRIIVVNCMLPDGTIDHFIIACELDEICVNYDDKYGSAQVLCIKNPYVRTWASVENKLSCSSDLAYIKAEDVHTGVTTYYDNRDIANMYELQTFLSD